MGNPVSALDCYDWDSGGMAFVCIRLFQNMKTREAWRKKMKNENTAFHYGAVNISQTFFLTSCEKYLPGSGGKDKFEVSVSENTDVPGAKITDSAGDNETVLKYAPSSAGMKSSESGIWMGETEVTHDLWKVIYDWAIKNGYRMTSKGIPGSSPDHAGDHPVSTVSWGDGAGIRLLADVS